MAEVAALSWEVTVGVCGGARGVYALWCDLGPGRVRPNQISLS
jgi:hypothetical protein